MRQGAATREKQGARKCRGGGKEEGGNQESQGGGRGRNMTNFAILRKEV